VYQATKIYGHELGLSCAFRQWRAKSHCRHLHGYPLAFKLVFESDALDDNGWVLDFGGLKTFKQWLESKFDHKTIVAEDDPNLEFFQEGHDIGVFDLVVLSAVGCEKVAKHVYDNAAMWLLENKYASVRLAAVTVSEHGGNSATYINPTLDITKRAMLNGNV
jgi:6-pyruvoyltetrahydropterin/6-carboxytetrahydropterin synthase